MQFNQRVVIGVTYERIRPTQAEPYEQTLVILAVRYCGKVVSMKAVLPIERSKIPSDWTAAHLVMADLEVQHQYKIEMPIPAIWNIPTKKYISKP